MADEPIEQPAPYTCKHGCERDGLMDALTAAQAQAAAQEQRIAELEAENAAICEVDRLAEIASQWHWWNAAKCNEYEDKDDLFQDIDFARAKARAILERQADNG